jgi:hypothetical protein
MPSSRTSQPRSTSPIRVEGKPPITEAEFTDGMHQHLRVTTLPLLADASTAGEVRFLGLADPPLSLRDVPPLPLRRSLTRLPSALSAGRFATLSCQGAGSSSGAS